MKKKEEIIKYKKEMISLYKISKGCKKCGYNLNPRALQFAHLSKYKNQKSKVMKNGNGKSYGGGIHNLIRYETTEELLSEIKKTKVLCGNCHAEETYKKAKNINKTKDRINTIKDLEKRIKNFESN